MKSCVQWYHKASIFTLVGMVYLFFGGILYGQETPASSTNEFPTVTFFIIAMALLTAVGLGVGLLFTSVLRRFRSFSRDQAIVEGWNIARKRFRFFIGTLLLQRIISTIPYFFTFILVVILKQSYDAFAIQIFGVTLNMFTEFARILDILIGTFLMIGLIRIAFDLLDKKDVHMSQLFSGLSCMPRFLLAGILYMLCVLIGLILFIIPGLYIATALSLWPQYIVDKDMGPIRALKSSWSATKGARGELFLFYIMVLAINIGGILTFLVGSFLTIPLTLVAMNHVYRQLSLNTLQSHMTESKK